MSDMECGACEKSIDGRAIMVGGKYFCPGCFCCNGTALLPSELRTVISFLRKHIRINCVARQPWHTLGNHHSPLAALSSVCTCPTHTTPTTAIAECDTSLTSSFLEKEGGCVSLRASYLFRAGNLDYHHVPFPRPSTPQFTSHALWPLGHEQVNSTACHVFTTSFRQNVPSVQRSSKGRYVCPSTRYPILTQLYVITAPFLSPA